MDTMEVEEFLEHYGVKGMRWGKRGTRRIQTRIDRLDRVAKGTASTKDKAASLAVSGVVRKSSAERVLRRGANTKAKVNAGKLKVTNALSVAGGVKIKNLDYRGREGDVKAKLDGGQKAALAYIGVVGAVQVARLAKR